VLAVSEAGSPAAVLVMAAVMEPKAGESARITAEDMVGKMVS
jgi:hypothetical protein